VWWAIRAYQKCLSSIFIVLVFCDVLCILLLVFLRVIVSPLLLCFVFPMDTFVATLVLNPLSSMVLVSYNDSASLVLAFLEHL
jgi:hypothetical protein